MISNAQRWNLVIACLNVVTGVVWIVIALRQFRSSGDFLLACAAGLISLIAAAIGFVNWRRDPRRGVDRAVTTLFEHDAD